MNDEPSKFGQVLVKYNEFEAARTALKHVVRTCLPRGTVAVHFENGNYQQCIVYDYIKNAPEFVVVLFQSDSDQQVRVEHVRAKDLREFQDKTKWLDWIVKLYPGINAAITASKLINGPHGE